MNASVAPIMIASEIVFIRSFVEIWIQQWCPENGNLRQNWHIRHEAHGTQLLLLAKVARENFDSPNLPTYQSHLLELSLRVLTDALERPAYIHMSSRPIAFCFATAVVLKFRLHRGLVLQAALHLIGRPSDLFVPNYMRNAGSEMLGMLWCAD